MDQECAGDDRVARPLWPKRVLYLGIGWAAVGLGLLGVALPLLPTTPFLLIAAWAFAKASPALRDWLHGHPRLGPFLRAWAEERAVPRRAKVLAVSGMAASWVVVFLTAANPVVPLVAGLSLAAVAVWLVSRPVPAARSD